MGVPTEEPMNDLLNGWSTLNNYLRCTSRRDLSALRVLLTHAVQEGARKQVIQRIHQRYNRLRYEIEQEELFSRGRVPRSIVEVSG